jgi:hypothetical protein
MPPVGFDASVWKLGELGPLLLILLGKGAFQIVGTEYPMCSPACAFLTHPPNFSNQLMPPFSSIVFFKFQLSQILSSLVVCLYLIHCHSFEFQCFILY